jgi:hypothetical protein
MTFGSATCRAERRQHQRRPCASAGAATGDDRERLGWRIGPARALLAAACAVQSGDLHRGAEGEIHWTVGGS